MSIASFRLPAVICLAFAAHSACAAVPAPADGTPPASATGAPPPGLPDSWRGKKKLLVVADVQTGFHHDSINHAMAVIDQLGRERNEWLTVIRTDSQLLTRQPIVGQGTRYAGRPVNARSLDQFDAVFFLGSGAGKLDAQQKADLLSFVKEDGKGFIAGHAATVAYYDWPEYLDMIGGFMESEYRVEPMTLLNDSPGFPGASALPRRFQFAEQYPVMRAPFSSRDVHVILRLDPRTLSAEQLQRRPDGDLPVVWAKQYGKGRVLNLTPGHTDEMWDDTGFRQLTREGIRWAMGLVDAPVPVGNSAAPSLKKP